MAKAEGTTKKTGTVTKKATPKKTAPKKPTVKKEVNPIIEKVEEVIEEKVEDNIELEKARLETEKAQLEADKAQFELDKAKLDSDKEEVPMVASITDSFEDNLKQAKERGITKAKKRVFDDEDMIPVASFASGTTQLKNSVAPYDRTVWEGFGTVEDVRYGTLDSLRKMKPDAFKKMLYVLDIDVVKALNLGKIYEKIGSLEDIVKVLDKPLAEVIRYIDGANAEVKVVLCEILANKLERKEDINFFTVKAIAEKLGMELNLDF